MKKIIFFAVAALSVFSLISCGGKKIDSTKWLDSFNDGKIAAQKENKKIILFFSADDQDNLSAQLKENLLFKSEFVDFATEKYVLVNLDFSESKYNETEVDENASSAEKKAAKEAKQKLTENMDTATYFSVQMSPTIYLTSKEGYVITQLVFDDTLTSIEGFEAEIASHEAEITQFEETLAKTTQGTNLEKVSAIDDLFNMTDRRFAYQLAPLAKEVLKLDPKNDSGIAGKYVIELAQADATDAALENDVEKMIKVFETAAENKLISSEQKQRMYYYAGYYLGGTGSTDYKRVRDYIQKAYDADPESDIAGDIQNMIRIVDERIAETEQMNEDVTIEGNVDTPVEGETETKSESDTKVEQ
ncbi:MAG: thioredoxin family protein [Treponema sp.]|nr:thioredoxin family protein [Treponema sp.]